MASKKFLAISDPDNPKYQQGTLFSAAPTQVKYNPYPRLLSTVADCKDVIARGAAEGFIGLDLEFNATKPTILGVACRDTAVAVRWDTELAREVVEAATEAGATIVGHSTCGAEQQQMEKMLGIKTPITLWEDSMVLHHLVNSDFTKMAGKDESDDAGALGLMNLWVPTSMYTNLPHWKSCRGKYCEGPCPTHRVFDYCAVDSWASLEDFYCLREEMKTLNIPYTFYREQMELSEICIEMENKGLNVNRGYVSNLEVKLAEQKEKLFPFEMVNKKVVFDQFNPKSGAQILKYCSANGINLTKTTKGDVALALEKAAKKEGYEEDKITSLITTLEVNKSDLSPALDTLYRLYRHKDAGKGAKSWFAEKFFRRGDGKLHPRFIMTGTSTGRLSSSFPNLQNPYPEIKEAIEPDEGCYFLESDFSQLELRMCLYLAGVDQSVIGKDAFTWLAQNSDGQFTKAANMLGCDERQVGKRIAHAANYMEGFKLIKDADWGNSKIKTEIAAGALVVYKDWQYCGGTVAFTAANLAQALFGDKSLVSRRKALEIQEGVYFDKLPMLRKWQQRVLEKVEMGYVQSPVGRYLRLYGSPEDNAKIGVASQGQGTSSDHVSAVMIRFKRELGITPSIQCHDSIVLQIPKEWSDEKAKEHIGLMQQETWRLPGFSAPGKVKRGTTYGNMVQI